MRSIFSLLLLFLGCFGCQADKTARDLAQHTWQGVMTYEEQVKRKIDAEHAFYHQQLLNLRRNLVGSVELKEFVNPEKVLDTTDDMKKRAEGSLLYQKILVDAYRDARIGADRILRSSSLPPIMTTIIEVAGNGSTNDLKLYLELAEREKQLALEFLTRMEKIEQRRNDLKQVREMLAKLSATADLNKQLEVLRKHGQVILTELQEDEWN